MDINSKINITESLTQSELKEIVTLSRKHPYWHVPLAILARHFRIKGSEKIEVASAMAAMRVPSQTELYSFVYSKNGFKEPHLKENITPEAKNLEKKTPEKKTPEKMTPEKKTPEKKTPEKKTTEKKTTEKKTPEKKTPKKEVKQPKIHQEEKDFLETYEEISPFTTELKNEPLANPNPAEKNDTIELTAGEIEKETEIKSSPTEPEITSIILEKKEVREIESVERTLEEIESLMNRKDSFNIIPESQPEKTKEDNVSNSAMDVFDSSYDIADHFNLPEDSIVGEGEDFYFWLKQPLNEPKAPIIASEKKNTVKKDLAKPVKKKKAISTQNKSKIASKKSTNKKPSKADILDAFIRKNPSISKIDKEDTPSAVDYSNKAGEMPIELATETLARIYEEQGNLKAAKKIYTTLMLKFPTKKPYFADRINKLKKT